MNIKAYGHAMAALQHLRYVENELEESMNPVECIAQGHLRSACASVFAAVQLDNGDDGKECPTCGHDQRKTSPAVGGGS